MKPIHIFKTGTHTDSHGTQITFSEADLAGAVSAYDASKHQAPIVVGHPKTNNPAFGWITQLTVKSGNLYAEPEQVNADFSEQVKAGAYKKVSASFYPPNSPNNPVKGKYYLRHVGFLGAEPPAIKGLEPVEFGEGDSGDDAVTLELDFNEADNSPTLKKMFNAFMGWLGSSDFSELADKAEPSIDDEVTQPPADTPNEPTKPNENETPLHHPNKEDDMSDPTQPTQAELDAEKARVAELEKKLADKEQAEAEAAKKALHQANADFAEALVNDGKIAPKDKTMVAAILDGLDTADSVKPVEFGEGDKKTSLKQAVQDKLSTANTDTFAYLFSESAGKPKHDLDHVDYAEGTDPERAELDQKIRAYAKENELEYGEAAHIVMSM